MLACMAGLASGQTTWNHNPSSANGPLYWGSLTTPYETCGTAPTGSSVIAPVGMAQTPVNIVTANSVLAILPGIDFRYESTPFEVENTGHVVEVVYEEGSSIKLGRSITDIYNLIQFHFHAPSEHTVDGTQYDAELHLVHQNILGQLVVVGVFLNKSAAATPGLFDDIVNAAPTTVSNAAGPSAALNANMLLPEDLDYFTYTGSLTTPPCSEGVRWFVMQTPMPVTEAAIQRLHLVVSQFPGYNGYENNNRPVAPLNGRTILSSYE
jgi:carbonic anhydrase